MSLPLQCEEAFSQNLVSIENRSKDYKSDDLQDRP